jgi:hypothetical protein
MRFYTSVEARELCQSKDLFDETGFPRRRGEGMAHRSYYVGTLPIPRVRWAADRIVQVLGPWEEAFAWIDAPLTWNRENLQLYYRLRQSYGDYRLIREAPVHYFMPHEQHDMLSFVQIGLMNEWQMFLYTVQDYGRVTITREGEVLVSVRDSSILATIADDLEKSGMATTLRARPP